MEEVKPTVSAHDWHEPDCYACGPENPHNLQAVSMFDEEHGEVRFSYVPPNFVNGAPGYIHGGALATVLDEAQGSLCFNLGHSIMTDQLYMRYHKATPRDQELAVRCWVTTVRKRRMYTQGTIHSKEGELLVSSHARWYMLPERISERLFGNTMTPEEHAQNKAILEANRKRAQAIRRRLKQQKKG